MGREDFGVEMDLATRVVLRLVEEAGFHVSVHAMGDYVEAHAVPCIDPAAILHLARVDGGDGVEEVRQVASLLAEMVGVDLADE